MSIFPTNHTFVPLVAGPQTTEINVYGVPITITPMTAGGFKLEAWMPGQINTSEPLHEQSITHFHLYEIASKADTRAKYNVGSVGVTATAAMEWAKDNYKTIMQAQDERDRAGVPPMTYVQDEYDFGSNNHHAPSWPTPEEREAKQRTDRAHSLRNLKDARDRKDAQLQELETLPGYGSF